MVDVGDRLGDDGVSKMNDIVTVDLWDYDHRASGGQSAWIWWNQGVLCRDTVDGDIESLQMEALSAVEVAECSVE